MLWLTHVLEAHVLSNFAKLEPILASLGRLHFHRRHPWGSNLPEIYINSRYRMQVWEEPFPRYSRLVRIVSLNIAKVKVPLRVVQQ